MLSASHLTGDSWCERSERRVSGEDKGLMAESCSHDLSCDICVYM